MSSRSFLQAYGIMTLDIGLCKKEWKSIIIPHYLVTVHLIYPSRVLVISMKWFYDKMSLLICIRLNYFLLIKVGCCKIFNEWTLSPLLYPFCFSDETSAMTHIPSKSLNYLHNVRKASQITLNVYGTFHCNDMHRVLYMIRDGARI
jgi:hypothetical protein